MEADKSANNYQIQASADELPVKIKQSLAIITAQEMNSGARKTKLRADSLASNLGIRRTVVPTAA
jgi:hypothetical protein